MANYLGMSTYTENLSCSGEYRNAVKCQAPATGTLINLQVLIISDAGGNAKLALYADNAGVPGALLVDAGSVALSNGWNIIGGLSLPITLNTYYWIGFHMESAAPSVAYNISTNNRAYQAGSYENAFANPFGTPDGYNEYCWCLRGEIAEAGGLSIPVAMDIYRQRRN